ncbi:hypothetical protein FGO68_gene3502 [Halteria grandinella]|uniref:Uncharacterized protein n=1 Tax=Halteria grandinella TaxID=5974 RepID=A0A8J8NKF5_HALGN|nr:hypothetical protein FGO68_gene3502 [Halteria grandinella]
MCFFFSKQHTLKSNQEFSFKTNFKLDSREGGAGQDVNLLSTNYFNYHQDSSALDNWEAGWFQSKLTLEPQHGNPHMRINPSFCQTILVQKTRNMFFGAKLRFLNERKFSLIFFSDDQEGLSYFEIHLLKLKMKQYTLSLTEDNDIVGTKISYDHRRAEGGFINGFSLRILHCYPLVDDRFNSYLRTQFELHRGNRVVLSQVLKYSFFQNDSLVVEAGQKYQFGGGYSFGININFMLDYSE